MNLWVAAMVMAERWRRMHPCDIDNDFCGTRGHVIRSGEVVHEAGDEMSGEFVVRPKGRCRYG